MFSVLRLILVGALMAAAGSLRAELLFYSDFESGSIQDPHGFYDGWFDLSLPGGVKFMDSGTIPARSGSKLIKMSIYKDKDYSSLHGEDTPRADLGKSSPDYRFIYGKDYWIGFSIFIPSSWAPEKDDQNEEVFMQIKHWGSGGAPIFNIYADEDKWTIKNRTDPNYDGFNEATTKVSTIYESSFLDDRGKWIDWAVHLRLCEKTGCNGLIEVYKNGNKVVSRSGANAYKVDNGKYPYLLIDLYKSKMKERYSSVSSREVYFDEVRIGGSNSSLAEVSPPSKNVNLAPLPPYNLGIQ